MDSQSENKPIDTIYLSQVDGNQQNTDSSRSEDVLEPDEDSVRMVMLHADCSRRMAVFTLKRYKGDAVSAIIVTSDDHLHK